MYENLHLHHESPLYLQIKGYIKDQIMQGVLQAGARLPATRELAAMLKVGRNTVILAYQDLEDDGLIRQVRGQGAFVTRIETKPGKPVRFDWEEMIVLGARLATELDIEKKEIRWEKGLLSFKSISPDGRLFGTHAFKRAFLDRFALEGEKLLNYGYAKGYRPLNDYLLRYLQQKGVNPAGKDILITNGFTEAFNLVLRALTQPGDTVVCENPTHNTALKIMRLAGLNIEGIPMRDDGPDAAVLERILSRQKVKLGFLIPSYHNPTGLVMPFEKRLAIVALFNRFGAPLVEDGFNEELRFSGSHVAPLIALAGEGNNITYLGSFSKILFPGLRIGWIMGDQTLIGHLESMKRSLNIHTSFLDQAILYEYLHSGQFEKYLKKARKYYREKHQTAMDLAVKYIPHRKIWGEGGLHILIEMERLNARDVLAACHRRGVIFMPGDIFFADGSGQNFFRLGISRVGPAEMEQGFRIIGEVMKAMDNK